MTTTIVLNVKTVTALRREGSLSEAFSVAEELLAASPENIWNARAMGWVLLDRLKFDTSRVSGINNTLTRLLRLNLPDDEDLFYSQLRWRLGKALYHCEANEVSSLEQTLCQVLQKIPVQSGEAHSFLLKGILKHQESWRDLGALIQFWGYDNFSMEDKQPEKMPDGRKLNCLAERAYMAVAKWLLAREDNREGAFTQMIGNMENELSEWKFLAYYYALLLKKQNRVAEALSIMVDYSKKNRGSFWVWDLMATLTGNDASTACLVKAVSCKAPEEYLVKIRQKLAAIWIESGNWNAAAYEIEKLVRARNQKGWRVPDQVMQWRASVFYPKHPVGTPYEYTCLLGRANALLLDDEKCFFGIIVGVNDEKCTAQFYVSAHINGGFKQKQSDAKLALGQPVKLWLEKKEAASGAYWQVQQVVSSEHVPSEDQRRSFSGIVRRSGSIGFVEEVMVPGSLVSQTSSGWPVEGTALRAYDSKKQKWGWKALRISDVGKRID